MCKCKDRPYEPAVARMVGNMLAGYNRHGVHFLDRPDAERQLLEDIAIKSAERVVQKLTDKNA